jgi:transcriptional regulator with XRE-family HTH domain
MGQDEEDRIQREWREGFRTRMIQARGDVRTQGDMAELLGIERSAYSKYEAPSRKTILPPRLYPNFCKICGIDLVWFLTGETRAKVKRPNKVPAPKRAKAS